MNAKTFYQWFPQAQLITYCSQHKTPLYLLLADIIKQQITVLRQTLASPWDLYYAVKANPNPEILALMAKQGLGADVASDGELNAALAAGITAKRISFSGPGKTDAELRLAMQQNIGALNLESLEELEQALSIATEFPHRSRLGLRINPENKGIRSSLKMAGATPFGISETDAPEALRRLANSPHIEFAGLHVHAGSQVLEADSILANIQAILDLALRLQQQTGLSIPRINCGGGLGIPYFPNQTNLNLEILASGLRDLKQNQAYQDLFKNTELLLEPGRFLVAESGIYVTRVLYRKTVADKHFAIVDGGMHHNYLLAGGMGQIIRRNFEMTILSAPENSAPKPADFNLEVAGCLCTPQDVLASSFPCNQEVRRGDFIVFFNCGAYGLSASPTGFLSHSQAVEKIINRDDNGKIF
ncbi:alanine racemase [Candidatus Venteria ishoeyi]|uniref:L-glutamyl-[BtrI acyl-carrier protein] decarboxylase n=1 Tax=Candidatus Venteria ishoeyi TaxID=1899563 RepID=A0A1H6F9U1_9GAMM|nr:alanine racemase [Candidatus Venteria ishoeyi]MDM8546905.1 alanine racemase [Candidatus Venteria ishoeyi]SEH06862.1 L-glutamyl-[BtrI acyl-carrier protein] decarboxylase [Candidatus Venteria ishoeyi]